MPWTYGPVTVMGHLASKANGRRKVNIGGRTRFIKSAAALDFASTFPLQLKAPKQPFDGLVAMYVWVYYQDWKRDLDIALLQDCIQKAGIITNDRHIVEIYAKRLIDKKHPKVVFELQEVGPQEALGNHHGRIWANWATCLEDASGVFE